MVFDWNAVDWAFTTLGGVLVGVTRSFVKKVNVQGQRLDKLETVSEERYHAIEARLDSIDEACQDTRDDIKGLTTYLLNHRPPLG